MKESHLIFIRSMCIVILFDSSSCTRSKNTTLPELETLNVKEITMTSAKSGGQIISDNHAEITLRGVCWDQNPNPTLTNSFTIDGSGDDSFESALSNLTPDNEYYVRAYATNSLGTAYGKDEKFRTLSAATMGQIIADHTVVDRFDDIPQNYIDKVKEMWLVYAGESHSKALRVGLVTLENQDTRYSVNVLESGTPESNTTTNLRASRGTWGDYSKSTGWVYSYGENDWFTNSTGINRTKAGITYCNTHDLEISAIGFGWCWDDVYSPTGSPGVDPVYGCRWYGVSLNGPEGDRPWGLDADDYSVTGNTVCLDTYLEATQEYIDYCKSNGYNTKIYFSTGPVDTYYNGERGYQAYLKHERTRAYVRSDTERILFDYADILCYDDGMTTPSTLTWNGHTYPAITATNLGDGSIGHIGEAGALRLAKAMWWMLARIAGWDGG